MDGAQKNTYWIEVDYSDFATHDEVVVRAQAAEIQTREVAGELIFRTTFPVADINLAEGDAIAQATQARVLGFRAATPVPPVLTETLPRKLAGQPQQLGVPARQVEAALLAVAKNAQVPQLALIRVYLHRLAIAQIIWIQVPDSPQGTLDFIVENWDAGDFGCAERYRDRSAFLAERGVTSTDTPSARRRTRQWQKTR